MRSMSNEAPPNTSDGESPALAKPIIEKRRGPILLVWLVPLLAAGLAVYYFREHMADHGREITVQFGEANGLKEGETPVSHRGVQIGKVIAVRLSDDQSKAVVRIRLKRDQDVFAKQGSLFWIVRPEFSSSNINGLETLFNGPYIEAAPGSGDFPNTFDGLDGPPLAQGDGLRIVLHAPRLEHLQEGAPVYYRGIQVGVIDRIQLSGEANSVDVQAFIYHRYSPLVRFNSVFWVQSALDVKGGLLSGVQMKLDSIRSLFSGGVTFATPEKAGAPVRDGENFPLFNEPKKEWLEWAPKITTLPE